jgi:long-chain acyl-CoA synthetase
VEKIWLKHYPKDVPPEIDINEYASVREVFEESVAKFGERPSYTCMGKTLTFDDLDALSAAFGSFLQDNGCGKGTRVALMMPNILQYPVCPFGILRAGCGGERQSARYRASSNTSATRAPSFVVVENFAHVVQEVVGRTKVRRVIVTTIGDSSA